MRRDERSSSLYVFVYLFAWVVQWTIKRGENERRKKYQTNKKYSWKWDDIKRWKKKNSEKKFLMNKEFFNIQYTDMIFKCAYYAVSSSIQCMCTYKNPIGNWRKHLWVCGLFVIVLKHFFTVGFACCCCYSGICVYAHARTCVRVYLY